MDFAYMRKPVLYYQFDYERFREGHMGLGYFDYHRDAFGPICESVEVLNAALEEVVESGYVMADIYKKRCDAFFFYHDHNYCKRNYEAIKKLPAGSN
jgi:CDP-glycerol glycerophosphotransferase (TagB/SpsB family)